MKTDRAIHAAAWWLWAAGVALAGVATSNPLVLLALCALSVVVASLRCRIEPGAPTMLSFVNIALFVLAVRLLLQVFFGQRSPGHVIFRLPQAELPQWLAGVSLGGPVTVESLLTALQGGLRLCVIILAFGAANTLASPRDLLRSLPGVLHEVAVAITVALCFTPELMASVRRLHEARTLRGRPTRGIAGMRGILVPALEDALDSATMLAASMGSRGFGRSVGTARTPRINRVLVVAGVLILLSGIYGLLAPESILPAPAVLLLLGSALIVAGVLRSHRRSTRTRYRKMPLSRASYLVALLGWVPATSFWFLAHLANSGLSWSPSPLSAPPLAPLALLSILVSVAVLIAAPAPKRTVRQSSRLRQEAVVVS